MSDKRYLGNIITQNPTAPAGNLAISAAKGVWSLEEQLAYQKAGLWPVPGNFPLNVEDVFSTYLYTGNGGTNTITNGIDLAGEGGLVWLKDRSAANGHRLYDSERDSVNPSSFAKPALQTNGTNANLNYQDGVTTFNSNGFVIEDLSGAGGTQGNTNNNDYASWTFLKSKRFFDIQTWTGDGTGNRTIAHSLNGEVGMIILKKTSATGDWYSYHRSLGNTKAIALNSTGAAISPVSFWQSTTPTSSEFYVNSDWNDNGQTYAAYLFAHNDGDGEFGPNGNADAIKCGSYTGSGSAGNFVNLGFEPQWVMFKNANRAESWYIWDTMRGIVTDGTDARLLANTSGAEVNNADVLDLNPTGFTIEQGNSFPYNYSGDNYIYIAIRRPTAVPTSATEVFAPNFYGTNGYVGYLGAPADMHMLGYRSGNSQNAITSSRLIQGNKALVTSSRSAEITSSSSWDNMSGVTPVGTTLTTLISWTWKRASGFMDCVAYSGDGTTARAIPHNLGVPPQLMIHKRRNSTNDWYVPDFINSKLLFLNDPAAANNTAILANYYGSGNGSSGGAGSLVTPDASTFTVTPNINVNASGGTYIVYLFATLAGISKVGSVTHSGTTNVGCGFSSGARFVLLKRTDATGDWYVWDSVRGIVSGNDPYLLLNSTAAEVTNTDYIDPLSSGFTITSSFTAGTYIFYAIA